MYKTILQIIWLVKIFKSSTNLGHFQWRNWFGNYKSFLKRLWTIIIKLNIKLKQSYLKSLKDLRIVTYENGNLNCSAIKPQIAKSVTPKSNLQNENKINLLNYKMLLT